MRYGNPGTSGFRWGQVDVVRTVEVGERKVVSVSTDYHDIQVTVSPKGQSVQVHVDGECVWPLAIHRRPR